MKLTLDMIAKDVAEKALDEITYEGKTIREWVEIIAKQQPCEDCISREAVEKITWEEPSYDDALNVLTEVRDKVKALPPVKPQRPKGRWIEQTDKNKKLYGWFYCSECGAVLGRVDGANYCSECGAEMEGSNE